MVICGVSGRRRRAAAALAVDGRLVAASVEGPLIGVAGAGYAGAPLPLAAIDACLAAAGATRRDITHLVRAEGAGGSALATPSLLPSAGVVGGPELASWRVGRLAAYGRLAHAAGASAVLVVDGAGVALIAPGGAAIPQPGLADLVAGATVLAAQLGLEAADAGEALGALELLASAPATSDRDWFAAVHAAGAAAGLAHVGQEVIVAAVQEAAAAAGAPLDDPATPHVRVTRLRSDVAASYLQHLAARIAAVIATSADDVTLAGGALSAPDVVARVRAAVGRAVPLAPATTPEGAALGAALFVAPLAAVPLPACLALGAPVTEPETKAVLENCRLDYLYEPRWPRLLERVSQLLERGKLVAWFQGPAEFGHPLYGSRSILCDPSNRYARDNVNVFLRARPLATPVPVALADTGRAAVDGAALVPWALARTAVAAEARETLRAAIDARGCAHAHVVPAGTAGPFAELLALHHQRTGVPGLVNLPLAAAAGAEAVTARDAVRAAFGSPVDALVLHRFLVVKDYWQMHAG